MADAGWGIRFYDLSEERESVGSTLSFVSNFANVSNRQDDNVRVFRSMYGLDNYLIWEVQHDLPHYDFSKVGLECKLFLHKNPLLSYFIDYYRVMDVKYDPKQSRYVVYCLSEDSLLLRTKLLNSDIVPPTFREKQTGIQLLTDMLKNICSVIEHPDDETTKTMIHFEYRYLNFQPDWTVFDLIDYIATECQYEWYLEDRTLHIGHALHALDERNCTKPIDKQYDHLSFSHFFFKVNINPYPINVLGHFKKSYRCVWIKHWAGATGGITKGAFIPIGWGHLDKQLFINCLEGDLEKNQAYSLLMKPAKYPAVTIGNILEDEGGNTIKSVSVQKNPNVYSMKTPNDIIIDRVGEHEVMLAKHEICRTTPYLDHEAGILFPSPYISDEPPPNSILFNINNRGEASVVGPYVYGSGRDDLVIPVKGKGDFRLQLPNGACIYIYENNDIIIQQEANPKTKPTGSGNYIKISNDGTIQINGNTTLAHKDHDHKGAPATDAIFKLPILGNVAQNTKGTTKMRAD